MKGDLAASAEALNRYFEKNHAYRSGEYDLPRAYLEVDEHALAATAEEHGQMLGWHRSGEYAWTPFSESAGETDFFRHRHSITLEQGWSVSAWNTTGAAENIYCYVECLTLP